MNLSNPVRLNKHVRTMGSGRATVRRENGEMPKLRTLRLRCDLRLPAAEPS